MYSSWYPVLHCLGINIDWLIDISKWWLRAANEMGSQLWCYSSLSRHVIQVCGMLHQSGSTFRHGALFLILHFQMVSTRCKRNGKSTVVLHFAFQTHHPGLRNVAPIWIHIPTWCTFSHPTFANGGSYMFNLNTSETSFLVIDFKKIKKLWG